MFMSANKTKTMKKPALKSVFSKRPLLVAFLAFTLVGATIGVINNVNAQSLQDQINQLRNENATNQSNVDKLQEVATSYEDAIATLQHDISETEQAIAVSRARQADIEAQIVAAEAELEKQKGLLSSNIRAMYIEGDISTLEMLASSNNLSEFIDKQQYRDSVKNKITSTLATINQLKQQLAEQKAQVEVELAEQNDSRARLASARSEQNRLLSLNESEQAAYNQKTQANEAKIKELQAAQAALAAQIAGGNLVSLGPISQGTVVGTVGNTGLSFGAHLHFEVRNGNGTPVNPNPYLSGADGWIMPVEGGYVSQQFGNPDPIYLYGYHAGIDFAGVTNRPIYAVADGEIVRNCRGYCGGYGNSVMIRHSNGLYSLYAHMN